ncbi:MAG: gamma-glutamyl-gamma-aminobutyrate hydrolase family protein [Bacteroidaceae bacterium]|nr:gamma-glutamyl-gamma-aminobutyrate hydrolase family protein [Bacteroidaceae bacterium]
MTDSFDWKHAYDSAHACFPGTRRKPLIGITGNFGDKGCELAEGYYQSVVEAGATPVVLPPTEDLDVLTTMLDSLDALILSGGGDINPLFLGEEPSPALHGINPRRDKCELMLTRLAFDRQLPILGICRGCQMLAAALGGSVWQDIPSPAIKHSQDLDRSYASHSVNLADGSMLRSIFGTGELAVNSFHHQAVREAGPHLHVVATAPDGVIEAVESSEMKSIIGVQWHPECFVLRADASMRPLFLWLTAEAQSYADARRLHSRTLTLDSHCDTPMFFDQDIHFDHRDPRILMDLHKMHEGGLDACIMVAYLPQGKLDAEGYAWARRYADERLGRVRQLAADNASALVIARTPAELYRAKADGKHAIMLGIENGYAIGRDLSLIDHFAGQGVVYITLCHNGNNDICGSARPREGEPTIGITSFGAQVIRRMNERGVMVDLSHASEKSFYDALEISSKPVVCSHSSSRALCDHPRNLTDDQLKALARRGGVAQATFYNGFLCRDGEASIADAVAHIRHMVDVAGIEHVGIGSDFDGDGGVRGLASASEMINLTRRLKSHFSDDDLRLLWGANFLRVMEQVQE